MAEFIRFEASEGEESVVAHSDVESEEEVIRATRKGAIQKKKPKNPLEILEKSLQAHVSETDSSSLSDDPHGMNYRTRILYCYFPQPFITCQWV